MEAIFDGSSDCNDLASLPFRFSAADFVLSEIVLLLLKFLKQAKIL